MTARRRNRNVDEKIAQSHYLTENGHVFNGISSLFWELSGKCLGNDWENPPMADKANVGIRKASWPAWSALRINAPDRGQLPGDQDFAACHAA